MDAMTFIVMANFSNLSNALNEGKWLVKTKILLNYYWLFLLTKKKLISIRVQKTYVKTYLNQKN